VRIIAGSRRGARIAAPKGQTTRPTGDRVREAAYNLIGPVDGASVLDLYAGSGAMGLEALSRGAERATFVENDRAACRAIAYDLVLVDPPYGTWEDLESRLAPLLPRVLEPDGLLVVETGARTEPALPLAQRTSRRYGSARLTLFEHPA
jgi:16S rRNA (guanine966-N2)-methyltransferase